MKTITGNDYFTLKEESLSDGSKVYNLETTNGRTICLNCQTEDEAITLFKVIDTNVSSVL